MANDMSSNRTLGERWRRWVRRMRGRPLPVDRRLAFAKAVSDRYAASQPRLSLAREIHQRQRDDAFEVEPSAYPWAIPGPARSSTDQGQISGRAQSRGDIGAVGDLDAARLSRSDGPGAVGDVRPTRMLREGPQGLAPQARDYLGGVLQMQIPAVKIHTDQAADRVARRFDADAVSFGHHILFRAGKYDPRTPRGLALLGHELTHAANARMTGHAQTCAGQSPEIEEIIALRNEQAVLDHASSGSPAPSWRPSGTRTGPPAQSAPPPRAAASDRDIDVPRSAESRPSSVLAEEHMARIKDEVYRDLMDRIRTDFERGA